VPADAPAVFERWARDPEVTRYLAWRPHTSAEQAIAHVERVRAGWEDGDEYTWLLETRTGGELLGAIAARVDDHGVNLGYVLGRASWGQGYMTEAVAALAGWYLAQEGVFRIWATCDPANRGSARVLEKAGFVLEGTLRAFEWRPNISPDAPCDALCYARVRSVDAT
jgi:RimJ/RimL family protein N-acetyltransferase